MPEVRKKFDGLGLETVGNTPAELTADHQEGNARTGKQVAKDAGIKLGN